MRRLALVFFAIPALVYAQDPAPQGVKLAAKKAAVGDKVQVSVESVVDLDITIKDSEPERTIQLSQARVEQFQQEVVAAQDGATQSRVTCAKSMLQRVTRDQPMENVATDIQGKVFLVKPANSRPIVTMADGSKPPAGAENVAGWECFEDLLPAQEVKPGDKWNVEKDVAELLSIANPDESEKKEAKIEASLDKVEGAIATIGFKGEIEGKTKDGALMKVTVTAAEMAFNKDTGRPVSIHVAGELETVKDVMHDYMKPGSEVKTREKIGEIRTKSRRLEVTIKFE